MQDATVLIRIRSETQERLDKLKVGKEPYDSVVQRAVTLLEAKKK